jgi:hypothetical protein
MIISKAQINPQNKQEKTMSKPFILVLHVGIKEGKGESLKE